MGIRILNLQQVIEKTSLSEPTIWRKERAGDFPTRRKISSRRVGWVEEEVDSWLEQKLKVNTVCSNDESA
jgi:prophage regulatory protein